MGKRKLSLAVSAVVLVVGAGLLFGEPSSGDKLKVVVQRSKIMEKPRTIGKVVAEISRGQVVTYVGKKRAFYEVKTSSGDVGFIRKDHLVDESVALSDEAGKAGGGASDEELDAASRGFSEDVEKKYKADNSDLQFQHVDAIQELDLDLEATAEFAEAGKLKVN